MNKYSIYAKLISSARAAGRFELVRYLGRRACREYGAYVAEAMHEMSHKYYGA